MHIANYTVLNECTHVYLYTYSLTGARGGRTTSIVVEPIVQPVS